HAVVRACGGDDPALGLQDGDGQGCRPDCPANDIIRVVWRGTSNATAEDAVDPESRETRIQEAEAADLLKEFLREPRTASLQRNANSSSGRRGSLTRRVS